MISKKTKNIIRFVSCVSLLSCAKNVVSEEARGPIRPGVKAKGVSSQIEYVSDRKTLNLVLARGLRGLKEKKHNFNSSIDLRIESYSNANLGIYKIQNGSLDRTVALQIPHGIADLYTRRLGEVFCSEFMFHVCGYSTGHRREYDFAHRRDSPFQDLTNQLLDHDSNGLVVQFHGFTVSKRTGERGKKAKMILSGGHKRDSAWIVKALKNIGLDRDQTILVYGRDTSELGATKNVQNRLIRSRKQGKFFHIELSYKYRQKLINHYQERLALQKIIQAVAAI